MVLPPSFSRKMGEIETVEAEKMGWIYLPRGTFYPTLPYISRFAVCAVRLKFCRWASKLSYVIHISVALQQQAGHTCVMLSAPTVRRATDIATSGTA